MPRRLAIFDLDGTLIPHPSAEWRFFRYLLRLRRIGLGGAVHAAAFTLRGLPRYGRHVLKKNKAYLAGMAVNEGAALGCEFSKAVLEPLLRPRVVSRLRAHQSRGDDVLLLTGAPDFIARPLCAALTVSSYIATECRSADGHFLAQAPRIHPFGDDKLRLTKQRCERLGYSLPREVVAYADSIHDRSLLLACGTAVAVHPDRALSRVARARGWAVLD